MSVIKLDKFGGQLPAWDDRLLPEGQAAYSRDCYLYSGALTGWRKPKLLTWCKSTTTQFVYRIPNKDSNDTSITASDSFWMEFDDPLTNVMRSPVVQDSYDRYYWANSLDVPRYNTYDRITGGQNSWILGVPASGCAPGITVSGGGDTLAVGYQNVDPNATTGWQYVPGNAIILVPIVPTGSMIIQSVSFYPIADANFNFQAVVYSDLNGKPYQLLGTGESTPTDLTQTSQTSVILNGVSVISNTTYWLGIISDGSYQVQSVDASAQGSAYGGATFSNGPPDPLNANNVGISQPTYNIWGNLLGASIFDARSYVYTWVTEYGEEGPPSPPVLVNGWSNATWTVDLFQPTLNNMGGGTDPATGIVYPPDRNIKYTNIYRTVSSQSGMGSYFFVAQIPVTQGQYVDTIGDDVVALNAQLVSLYWYGPPSDMVGIAAFPNGIAVGFRKNSNELWFSEAYRPHAWPPGYVLTTEFPIVGIGVAGQSIVVCTKGSPYVVNGVNPASMALTKINLSEPCLFRGSIVATDLYVFYASKNGLIRVAQSGAAANITEGWITREKWAVLTVPQPFAVKHATSYFAFGATPPSPLPPTAGFTIEMTNEDQQSFTIWPQAGGHRLGFNLLSSPNGLGIRNVELDAWTGTCLLVQTDGTNVGVWYYDFTDQNPYIVPYLWRSKVYQQQARRNFEAMKVFFSVPNTTPAQDPNRDVTFPQLVLDDDQYAIVRVYVDDVLWCTREVRSSGELLRIFSGIKGEQWRFELEGRINIFNAQIATSVKELALV